MKGRYLMQVGQWNKACDLYKWVLRNDNSSFFARRDACRGLVEAYQSRGQTDSLVKYALLSDLYCDSLYKRLYTADLQRMHAMFNFNRYKSQNTLLVHQMEKRKWLFSIVAVSLLALFFIVYALLLRMKHKHLLMKVKNEELKNDLDAAVKNVDELNVEISRLSDSIASYVEKYNRDTVDARLFQSEEYKELLSYLRNDGSQSANDSDRMLVEIDTLFAREFPDFHSILVRKLSLRPKEYRVCQLVRLGLSPKEMTTLLACKGSALSMMRRRLLEKLDLGMDGNAELDSFVRKL